MFRALGIIATRLQEAPPSMRQRSFAPLSFELKKRPTRRERFLGEMDKVVPSEALLALIEPSYPWSGRRGRFGNCDGKCV